MFHLVTGGALLVASVLAGLVWDRLGAPPMFMAGAAVAAVALGGLCWLGGGHPDAPHGRDRNPGSSEKLVKAEAARAES